MIHLQEIIRALAITTVLLFVIEKIWPGSVLMHISIGAFFIATIISTILYLVILEQSETKR